MLRYQPIMTYILIAINVIVFVVEFFFWGSTNTEVAYNFWAMYTPAIIEQPRRMFTAMFLHFWWTHIFMNMYALYSIGPLMEKVLWKWKYLIVYLLSWISWNLLVYFWESFTWVYSLGAWASGAIFGLLWWILALVLILRSESKQVNVKEVVISILFSLAPWFLVQWISLTAHIWGLIWWFITTYIILLIRKLKRKSLES
jgi:rhomboid protease GluP